MTIAHTPSSECSCFIFQFWFIHLFISFRMNCVYGNLLKWYHTNDKIRSEFYWNDPATSWTKTERERKKISNNNSSNKATDIKYRVENKRKENIKIIIGCINTCMEWIMNRRLNLLILLRINSWLPLHVCASAIWNFQAQSVFSFLYSFHSFLSSFFSGPLSFLCWSLLCVQFYVFNH